MKERTKDLLTTVFVLVIGASLGATCMLLFGCGGAGWLGTGLLIEAITDGDHVGDEGPAGPTGPQGEQGEQGPPGESGQPGRIIVIRPAPIIITLPPPDPDDPPAEEEEPDGPPWGEHAQGRGPGNHPEHP